MKEWKVTKIRKEYSMSNYNDTIKMNETYNVRFESRQEAIMFICSRHYVSPYDDNVYIDWNEVVTVEIDKPGYANHFYSITEW